MILYSSVVARFLYLWKLPFVFVVQLTKMASAQVVQALVVASLSNTTLKGLGNAATSLDFKVAMEIVSCALMIKKAQAGDRRTRARLIVPGILEEHLYHLSEDFRPFPKMLATRLPSER